MSILDLIREQKEKNKYYTNVDDAQKKMQLQKDSIEKIKNYEWYRTIKEFWTIQANNALERMKTIEWTDLKELWKVQAMLELSEKFLLFLDARE